MLGFASPIGCTSTLYLMQIIMEKIEPDGFIDFKQEILSHNLKSGEIIIEINSYDGAMKEPLLHLITSFLAKNRIKTEKKEFNLIEASEDKAVESIKFALSTKPDYTAIDKEFDKHEVNKIAYRFISFFDRPKYLSVSTRLYQKELDLNDYWEYGGAILVDDKKIGIIWVNDLYNRF